MYDKCIAKPSVNYTVHWEIFSMYNFCWANELFEKFTQPWVPFRVLQIMKFQNKTYYKILKGGGGVKCTKLQT